MVIDSVMASLSFFVVEVCISVFSFTYKHSAYFPQIKAQKINIRYVLNFTMCIE